MPISPAVALAICLIAPDTQPSGIPADVFTPATPPCQPGSSPTLTRFAIQVDKGPSLPPAILSRTISQHGGSWTIHYTLRCPPGHRPATVALSSWVANSRCGDPRTGHPHARPRCSEITADIPASRGPGGTSAARSPVLMGTTPADECREGLAVGREADADASTTPGPETSDTDPVHSLTLRLDHLHEVYGPHDPLLGTRDVAITFRTIDPADAATGQATTLRDVLPLDREIPGRGAGGEPVPPAGWREADIPEDRRDATRSISPPDSLLIIGDEPGLSYFRLPERPVRYSTRYRLTFWYFLAPGSSGEFRCRIAQYRESPNAWRVLSDGGSDVTYRAVGRWVKVERIITTESEATTLAVDFRVTPSDAVAEVWIDDIILDRAGGSGETGP